MSPLIPLEQTARYADVPLKVEVRLDQRILTIGEILELGQGSVIKMSRSAGENLDIYIGGVLAAFGEIVVTEASTGVRITDFRQER